MPITLATIREVWKERKERKEREEMSHEGRTSHGLGTAVNHELGIDEEICQRLLPNVFSTAHVALLRQRIGLWTAEDLVATSRSLERDALISQCRKVLNLLPRHSAPPASYEIYQIKKACEEMGVEVEYTSIAELYSLLRSQLPPPTSRALGVRQSHIFLTCLS